MVSQPNKSGLQASHGGKLIGDVATSARATHPNAAGSTRAQSSGSVFSNDGAR